MSELGYRLKLEMKSSFKLPKFGYAYTFTEQGVVMHSSVLNNKVAVEAYIRIIRVVTKLRQYALTHNDILIKLAQLEKEVKIDSRDLENIFTVLKELIEKDHPSPRKRIGSRRTGEHE
jgi:hypothetical protein